MVSIEVRTCIRDTNWVDELVEEPSCTTEPLEHGDALSTDMVWE